MELEDILKQTLADTFSLYIKAQGFHWNIEGPDFVQYHEFLGELYTDLNNAVDMIAELIRTLDVKVSTSMNNLTSQFINSENLIASDYKTIFSLLKDDNDAVILSLMQAYKVAEDSGELGISNALQDRIQIHQKHGWMLRSITR